MSRRSFPVLAPFFHLHLHLPVVARFFLEVVGSELLGDRIVLKVLPVAHALLSPTEQRGSPIY